MTDRAALLNRLQREIDKRADSFRLPVDVEKLCAANGLPLKVEGHSGKKSRSDRRPPAEVFKDATGVYEIVLRRDSPVVTSLSPLERFRIAHEIAHVLIDRVSAWLPIDRREYYEREAWCDRLAARLLIPTSILRYETLAMGDWRASGEALIRMARRCNVPRRVAAQRTHELLNHLFFFALRRTNRKNGAAVWQVSWATGREPLLHIAARKMFDDHEVVGRLARAAIEGCNKVVTCATTSESKRLGMLALPSGRNYSLPSSISALDSMSELQDRPHVLGWLDSTGGDAISV